MLCSALIWLLLDRSGLIIVFGINLKFGINLIVIIDLIIMKLFRVCQMIILFKEKRFPTLIYIFLRVIAILN